MESHKHLLKWNISESSHKITLTLTWNFRVISLSQDLINKVQRTLHLTDNTTSEMNRVPQQLSQTLQSLPEKHRKTHLTRRLSQTVRRIRRTLSTSSTTHSPYRTQHTSVYHSHTWHQDSSPKPHTSLQRSTTWHFDRVNTSSLNSPKLHTSLHHGVNTSSPHSPKPHASFQRSTTWHHDRVDTSSPHSPKPQTSFQPTCHHDGSLDSQHNNTQLNLTSCSSDSTRRRHLKLSYRSEDEFQQSLQRIMNRKRSETQVQLECIRQQWHKTTIEWPEATEHGESSEESMDNGVQLTTIPLQSTPLLSHLQAQNTSHQTQAQATGAFIVKNSTVENSTVPENTQENQTKLQGTMMMENITRLEENTEGDTNKLQGKTTTQGQGNSKMENSSDLQGTTIVGECLKNCDKILTRYETDIT